MKLYTEEQLREAIYMKDEIKYVTYTADNIIDSLTPIELPSDEEVEKETDLVGFTYDVLSFFYGAKWVIEQIKKQDNGK